MRRAVATRTQFQVQKKKQKKAFLSHLQETGNITLSAKKAGVKRVHLYHWRDEDSVFRHQWDEAEALGLAAIEDEVVRRAVQGTLKPVFHQGEIVGHVKQYSDLLLMFLLKAKKPHLYRENYVAPESPNDGEDPKELLHRKLAQLAQRQGSLPPVSDDS